MAHGDERGCGTCGVDVVAEPGRALDSSSHEHRHELAALRRFEGPERPTHEHDDRVERVVGQRGDPSVEHTEQVGVVHEHRTRPGEEPLDERRPSRRRRSARQRLRHAALHGVRRPDATVVEQPGGAPLDEAVSGAGRERHEGRRQPVVSGRMIEHRQGTLERAQPFGHERGRVVVE